MSQKESAIGIFDSGMGGISLLGQALRKMPQENYLYLGDSRNQPYTDLPYERLKEISIQNCRFLETKGAKAILVACNTATVVAIEEMKDSVTIPVMGITPAIRQAAEGNGNGEILLLATETTLKSRQVNDLIDRHGNSSTFHKITCPPAITLVEQGILEGREMERLIRNAFSSYPIKPGTTLLIGCSHFGFLEKVFRKVLGDHLRIVDGGLSAVTDFHNLLKKNQLVSSSIQETPSVEFFNSLGAQKEAISRKILSEYLKIKAS